VTRRFLAVIAVVLSVGAVAAETGWAKTSLKTGIQLNSVLLNSAGQYEVSGKLISKSPACRFRRTVRLHVIHTDNSEAVVDTQKTKSGVGLFTLRAFLAPHEGLFVTVAARDVTIKSGKRLHCATGRTAPLYPAG